MPYRDLTAALERIALLEQENASLRGANNKIAATPTPSAARPRPSPVLVGATTLLVFFIATFAWVHIHPSLTDSSNWSAFERSRNRRHDFRYWLGIGDYAKLEAAAAAYLEGTNECVLDVRDRGLRYRASSHCAALLPLSKAYVDLGGGHGDEPTHIQLIATQALQYTWMAHAISQSGGTLTNAFYSPSP